MYTCYVFTWLHTNSNKYWGFYNLGIKDSISINQKELNNPVFSYCPDSKLRIYPASRMSSYYPATEWSSGYTIWQYQFFSSQIDNFINSLSAAIDSSTITFTHNSPTDYYLECNLISSNPFHKYDEIKNNCFAAVAAWTSWLGNSSMMTIYNQAHGGVNDSSRYNQYIPAAMYAKYGSSWQLTNFNNTPNTP